jgi:hypothetical protein
MIHASEEKKLFVNTGRPIVDPLILEMLSSLKYEDVLDTKKYGAHVFCQTYLDWIKSTKINHVSGTELYPYIYAAQGVTQGLDIFILSNLKRRFRFFKGEYSYAREFLEMIQGQWTWLDDEPLRTTDAVIVSQPFAALGKEHPNLQGLLFQSELVQAPIFLDCAYFGVCSNVGFDVSATSIETVAFSLSKVFAAGPLRAGILFSRKPIPNLSILKKWEYGNAIGYRLAVKLMERFSPDYVVNKYSSAQQDICDRHGLAKSQTILFGLGDQAWIGYSRDNVTNRICLSQAIEALTT